MWLPGQLDMGKKLVLMSDLPALTHSVPAQGGAPPGRCCLGGCHHRGAHFPWSNHLKKRFLWSESQGRVRAGKASAIAVGRFPGCGWGVVTPRSPPPKQLTANYSRVKSGNFLTNQAGEKYNEQLHEEMRIFLSRGPPV